MTDKPDTTREAVERMIAALAKTEETGDCDEEVEASNHLAKVLPPDALLALLDERDALRAEVEAQETNLLEQSAYIKRLEAEVAALADNLAHAQESLTAAGWEIVKLRAALGLNPMHAEVPNG